MITPYHAKCSIDECTILWVCGEPPAGNANYARAQCFIHHLAPHGMAGFVLTNGSMSPGQSGEGDIRRTFIEADLVNEQWNSAT